MADVDAIVEGRSGLRTKRPRPPRDESARAEPEHLPELEIARTCVLDTRPALVVILVDEQTGTAHSLTLRETDREGATSAARKYIIGRDPSCDICVDDASVSGQHCSVYSEDDDRVFVCDLSSANGTFIDRGGRIVTVGYKGEIRSDDALLLGARGIRFSVIIRTLRVDAHREDQRSVREVDSRYGRTPQIQHVSPSPWMPRPFGDLVHFSITAPAEVARGTVYLMDVWAHLHHHRQEIIARAREEAGRREIQIRTRGPVRLARGNRLSVHPKIEGFTIEPSADVILWEGEIGNVTFEVAVPKNAKPMAHPGICEFRLNGLRVATLRFQVTVGTRQAGPVTLRVEEARPRRAFASYASEDRPAVLSRVQGIQKGVPGIDVFLDVISLRSGDLWQERLKSEILSRDVLYLFWSQAASRSRWVDWEWRCALAERGLDFIDPIPLCSPQLAPPPQELASKHFNDWMLAHLPMQDGPLPRDD